MQNKWCNRAPRASALGVFFGILFFTLPARAKNHQVTIENMKFAPVSLNVKVGDTVVWVNQDIVPHTVTSEAQRKGKSVFDSGMIQGGQKFELKISFDGEFKYVCQYHPMMKASIRAKE